MAFVIFATTLFMRSVDPVIPQIANGLNVTPATAALLSTGFTLPYALDPTGAGRACRHVQQNTADRAVHACRGCRHDCMRHGNEFRNVDGVAYYCGDRGGRRFPNCAGSRRRPGPCAAAASCHRPAAVCRHERQSAWCVRCRRHRRSRRLARRFLCDRHDRSGRACCRNTRLSQHE